MRNTQTVQVSHKSRDTENVVMGLTGPKVKNVCADEGQHRFTRSTRKIDTHAYTFICT